MRRFGVGIDYYSLELNNTEIITTDCCRCVSFTCDLSLLDGEWDDQVKWSQPCHIQTIHSHRSVRCLEDRGQRSDTACVEVGMMGVVTVTAYVTDAVNSAGQRGTSFHTPTNTIGWDNHEMKWLTMEMTMVTKVRMMTSTHTVRENEMRTKTLVA